MQRTTTTTTSPGGGIGRRWRLKIFCPALDVPVQVRPWAPLTAKFGRALACAATLLAMLATTAWTAPARMPKITYPFSDQGEFWVNSEPLNDRAIRGQPVLVFFWTYGCYNCRNSLEWLNSVQAQYADQGLLILGVHTPEFPHEKNKAKVAEKTREYKITFPVMIDNDFFFWKDMHNEWWPTVYLYDKRGNLKGSYIGETHLDTPKAAEIDSLITDMLNS